MATTSWTGSNSQAYADPLNWTDGVPATGGQGNITLTGAVVKLLPGQTLDAGIGIGAPVGPGAPGGATLEALGSLTATDSGAISGPNDGLVESFTLQLDAGTFTNLSNITAGGPNLAGMVSFAPGTTLDNALSGEQFGRINVGGGALLVIGAGGVVANGGFMSAADPGSRLTVLSPMVADAGGAGTIEIGSSSTVELGGAVAASITTLFGALGSGTAFSTGLLRLDAPDSFAAQIYGFTVPGYTIDLAGAAVDATAAPTLDFSEAAGVATLVVTKSTAAGAVTLARLSFNDAAGVYVGADPVTGAFSIAGDGATGYNISNSAACFASGSRIRTLRGEVAVEALRVGDRVLSAFGGFAPVTWMGRRQVDCDRHPRPQDVWPVRVQAGAFGDNRPCRDLLLSPDHAVHVDGILVPVRYLVNGASIAQEAVARVTYWHVELPAHDVLFSENLETESYLDTGNRAAFEGEAVVMAQPDFALRVWQAESCVPLVTSGPEIIAIREMLLARAAKLGHVVTGDPDLRLCVDGRMVRGRVAGAEHRFLVPPGARRVRLASRSEIPAAIHADAADQRRLGVAVAAIRVDGAAMSIDDPALGSGWHRPESDWRWTDGSAELPAAGAREIVVVVAIAERYWLRTAELAVVGRRAA